MTWFVYIVECSDGSLYTGMTSDLNRREHEHNTDDRLGSKYIRSRRPVHMVYHELVKSKSLALKRELEIKGWSRQLKLELIKKNK